MPDFVFPYQAPYPRSCMGWDGDEFRVISVDTNARIIPSEVPTVFNYKDAYRRRAVDLTAAAGVNTLTLAGPGANELLVITTMVAWNAISVATRISMGEITGATPRRVTSMVPAAIGECAIWSGNMYVEIGWTPWCEIQGCVLNDDIFFEATGYLMRIAW